MKKKFHSLGVLILNIFTDMTQSVSASQICVRVIHRKILTVRRVHSAYRSETSVVRLCHLLKKEKN